MLMQKETEKTPNPIENISTAITDLVNELKNLHRDYSKFLDGTTNENTKVQNAETDIHARGSLFASNIAEVIYAIIRAQLPENKNIDDYAKRGFIIRLQFALRDFYGATTDCANRSRPLASLAAQKGMFAAYKSVLSLADSVLKAKAEGPEKIDEAGEKLKAIIFKVLSEYRAKLDEKSADPIKTFSLSK